MAFAGASLAMAAPMSYWHQDPAFPPSFWSGTANNLAPLGFAALPDNSVLLNYAYTQRPTINGFGTTATGGLVRMRADGTIDSGFAAQPASLVYPAFYVYPNGNLLLVGQWGSVTMVYRTNAEGVPDPGFYPAAISPDENGSSIHLQVDANGRILVMGDFTFSELAGHACTGVARLNADGTFDTGFRAALDSVPIGNAVDYAATQEDGKIVLSGDMTVGGVVLGLLRLNSDGSLDPSFDGKAALAALGNQEPRWIVAQPGGTLLAGGWTPPVRLLSSGAADPTYHSGAPTGRLFGTPSPFGKIYYVDSQAGHTMLLRLNADGTPDLAFGIVADFTGGVGLPSTWDDNTIYLPSPPLESTGFPIMIEFAGGVRVPNFNPLANQGGGLTAFARQPDGRMLVSGGFTEVGAVVTAAARATAGVVRLNADGSLDRSFTSPLAAGDSVAGIFPQPDGHVVVTGSIGGATNARLAADGSLVAGFGAATGVKVIAVDSQGRIYAFSNGGLGILQRYLPDGSSDPSFAPLATPAIIPFPVTAITSANPPVVIPTMNGKVFVAVQGTGDGFAIERLNSDGSVDESWSKRGFSSSGLGLKSAFCGFPDGSLMVVTYWELPTSANSYQYGVKISVFDSSGATVTTYDLGYGGNGDLSAFAGTMLDRLLATGGGEATVVLPPISNSTKSALIDVTSDGQAVILPFYSYFGNAFERIVRNTLSSPSASTAPGFFVQLTPGPNFTSFFGGPGVQVSSLNGSAVLSVEAIGLEPFSYQWFLNGAPIAGATASTLRLAPLQGANAGVYTVAITNVSGTAMSNPLPLWVTGPAAPSISVQPAAVAAPLGGPAAFSVAATGGSLSYQWLFNGVAIPGATGPSYQVPSTTRDSAGVYSVIVTGSGGGVISGGAALTAQVSRLVNLSSRAFVGTGSQALAAGFSLAGTGSKSCLIRGDGPALARFGIANPVATPVLSVFDSAGAAMAANAGWSNPLAVGPSTLAASVSAATPDWADAVGAFPLPLGSLDSALLAVVPGGSTYTAQADAGQGTPGVGIIEVYDADSAAASSRLVNLSSRAEVGGGQAALVAGFSVAGPAPESLLIRAVGPTLAQFGVGDPLAAPQLTLYDGAGHVIATNAGWGHAPVRGDSAVNAAVAPATTAAFSQVYSFPLPQASADSAMIVTLPSNASYSAAVTGLGNAAGTALIELYEFDP